VGVRWLYIRQRRVE